MPRIPTLPTLACSGCVSAYEFSSTHTTIALPNDSDDFRPIGAPGGGGGGGATSLPRLRCVGGGARACAPNKSSVSRHWADRRIGRRPADPSAPLEAGTRQRTDRSPSPPTHTHPVSGHTAQRQRQLQLAGASSWSLEVAEVTLSKGPSHALTYADALQLSSSLPSSPSLLGRPRGPPPVALTRSRDHRLGVGDGAELLLLLEAQLGKPVAQLR